MNTLHLAIALSFFGAITSIVLIIMTLIDQRRLSERLVSNHGHAREGIAIKRLPKKNKYGKLDKRFKQAGLDGKSRKLIRQYFMIQILTFIATLLLFHIGAALVALSLIHVLALWLLKRQYVSRQKAFEKQLCDAIQVISNAMKSGYSFFQALTRVVEDSPDPLASSFAQVVKEMSLGKAMENAFEQLLETYPIEDLQLMVSAILIQKEIGGNLADILDTMLETLRERQRIASEVSALTAQGRLSGWIVSLLPFAIGLFLFFINPTYIALLFTTLAGRVMLGLSLFNELMGIVLIKGIIKVEY